MNRQLYQPIKGDKIDEAIADAVNSCEYDVPLKRIQDGQYTYGTKKIVAKLAQNNKLLIKVGGGFLLIDEFLKNYAQMEYQNIQEREA